MSRTNALSFIADDATLVGRLHGALFEAAHVAAQARDAMGVNAAKVGEDQDVRGHAGVFGGHTELREDLFAKSAEGLFLDDVFLGHRDAPSCMTTNKGFVYKFADATTARRGPLPRHDHDAARHLGEEAIECLLLSLTVLRVLEDVGPERSEKEDAEPVRARRSGCTGTNQWRERTPP